MIRKPMIGILLFSLLVLSASCSKQVEYVPQVVIKRELPPQSLMVPTEVPQIEANSTQYITNGDLFRWSLELLKALNEANAEKVAMRLWYDSLEK